jgi:hypothetical protein
LEKWKASVLKGDHEILFNSENLQPYDMMDEVLLAEDEEIMSSLL